MPSKSSFSQNPLRTKRIQNENILRTTMPSLRNVSHREFNRAFLNKSQILHIAWSNVNINFNYLVNNLCTYCKDIHISHSQAKVSNFVF